MKKRENLICIEGRLTKINLVLVEELSQEFKKIAHKKKSMRKYHKAQEREHFKNWQMMRKNHNSLNQIIIIILTSNEFKAMKVLHKIKIQNQEMVVVYALDAMSQATLHESAQHLKHLSQIKLQVIQQIEIKVTTMLKNLL